MFLLLYSGQRVFFFCFPGLSFFRFLYQLLSLVQRLWFLESSYTFVVECPKFLSEAEGHGFNYCSENWVFSDLPRVTSNKRISKFVVSTIRRKLESKPVLSKFEIIPRYSSKTTLNNECCHFIFCFTGLFVFYWSLEIQRQQVNNKK